MKVFKTNSIIVNIEVEPCGWLQITDIHGKSIKNEGLFIAQHGGVEAILTKCIDSDKDAADFMIERLKRRDMVKKAIFNKTLAKRI